MLPRNSAQSGNVLFLILIAVALFAALSYAVTQSTRSGSGDASSEKAQLGISQIVQYATSIDSAVTRLTATGQCTLNQLSFEPPPFSGSGKYYNSGAPANFSCHVFHPSGGGVSYTASVPADTLDPAASITYDYGQYNFSGMWNVQNIGTTCLAASCNDLVLYVHGLSLGACTAINRRAGISFSVPNDLNEQMNGYEPQPGDYFIGTFPTPMAKSGVDQNSRFYGLHDGCLRRADLPAQATPYAYYHVIVAR